MLPRNFSLSNLEKPLNWSSDNQNDVNPFAQGLRMDLQIFFYYLYENSENGMDKERERGEFMEG